MQNGWLIKSNCFANLLMTYLHVLYMLLGRRYPSGVVTIFEMWKGKGLAG